MISIAAFFPLLDRDVEEVLHEGQLLHGWLFGGVGRLLLFDYGFGLGTMLLRGHELRLIII